MRKSVVRGKILPADAVVGPLVLDVVVRVVHPDEGVAEIEVEVFAEFETETGADYVPVAARKHRRRVRLRSRVFVERVPAPQREPVQKVVLHADADAPRVAPPQRQPVAVFGNPEIDRVDARPFGPRHGGADAVARRHLVVRAGAWRSRGDACSCRRGPHSP